MERYKHYKTVIPFLKKEDADVLCMQEVPEEFVKQVTEMGYHVHFQKEQIYNDGVRTITEGILIASKEPLQNIECLYYHKTKETLPTADNDRYMETSQFFILFATVGGMKIGTTHFPVTHDRGVVSAYQEEVILPFEEIVKKLPPHILCGDFNTPRGHNPMYERFTTFYTDNIPLEYKSSLDRNLHRLSDNPEKQFIFDDFMVDYIFTQEPYKAKNVRLEFGISDHAAVIGDVYVE